MGIRVGILLMLFLSCNLYSADRAYFNKLKTSVNLQEDEQLVILYQAIGSCVKCYLKPMDQVAKLVKEGRIKKYKLMALVLCDRDIEMKNYKKQHEWKNYLYRDDGSGRKRLGAKDTTYLSVFDFKGKKILDM